MTLPRSAPLAAALVALLNTLPGTAQDRPTDPWLTDPVDAASFATYLEFSSYDSELPFDLVRIESREAGGLIEEEIRFVSTQGQPDVTGTVFRPATAVDNPRGVVYIHGGNPVGHRAGGDLRRMQLMARAGWTVVGFDMLHWGGRDEGLFETFGAQEKADRLYNQPSLYLEFAMQTVKDVGRSFDILVEEYGIPADRVVLVGFSRGAQMAMIAGGADDRLAAVALIHGGHFDALENGHRPAACGANYIVRISPRPLLMMNGENDRDYFPDTAVRPLQRLLREPTQIRWTDAGHGALTNEDHTVLIAWLDEVMPR
jgi:dienelactone hydrolase